MADLKTASLAGSIPSDLVVFGADGQDAADPKPYPIALFDSRYGGVSGTQVLGAFKWLNSDAGSNELESLAHFTQPVVGGIYLYNFFDAARAAHSFGVAVCIATGAVPGAISGGVPSGASVGTIYRQTAGTYNWTGMAMFGTNGAVYALTPIGDSLYLGSLGFDTTGAANVSTSRLALVVAEAVAKRFTIRSGGDLLINAAFSVGFANCDMITTRVLAASGYIGEMFHIGSRTSKSNVSVPVAARLYSAGRHDSGNSFAFDSETQTFDFAAPRTTMGLVIENCNTGLVQVDALLDRHAFGVLHRGNTEKIIANYNINDTQCGIVESVIRFEITTIARGATTTIKTQRPHPFIVGDKVAFNHIVGTTGLNSGFRNVTAVPDRKTVVVDYDSSAQPDHVPHTGYIRQDADGNTTADSNRVVANYQRCFQALRICSDGSGFHHLTVESRRDPGWWIRAGYNLNVTISNGGGSAPGTVTQTLHGKSNDAPLILGTTGTLPTGLSVSTVYYIVNATANTYQLAATPGGSAVNNGVGTGTHHVYFPTTAAVTISNASPAVVNHTAHGYTNGVMVVLTTDGTLPAGLSPNVTYHIVGATTNSYQLAATPGGAAINTTDAGSGTHTAHYHAPIMIPLPIVEHKTGKNCTVRIDCRGNQGRLVYYVDRDEPAGASGHNDKGTIEVLVDDNCPGTVLLVDRANDLVGSVRAAETYDGTLWSDLDPTFGIPVPPAYPCPSVQVNQVKKAFDVAIHLARCAAREGIRYGDTAKGLWSTGITFAPAVVHMSTYDAASGAYATTQTALVFEACTNCKFSYPSLHGNITLMAGCQGAEITLPAEWVQHYVATVDAAATATFYIKGTLALSDILYQPWVRPGINVVVENVSDLGGAQLSYRDGKWDTSRSFYVNEATLESITSNINAKFRYPGLQVTASDTNIVYTSTGSAATDGWVSADGVTTLTTPFEQPWTATHVARMSVAPSTTLRNALDKLYFDLDQAGAWSLIRGIWVAQETEADAFLNLKGTSYTLTKVGSPTWTTNKGWTGLGTSVASVTITNGGSGYLSPPTVTFAATGTGGVQPTGTAVLTGTSVTSVTITNAGSGVISTGVTFSAAPSGGTNAAGTAVLNPIADYLDTGFSQLVDLDGTGQNDFCFGCVALVPAPNSNAHIMGAPSGSRANLNASAGFVQGYNNTNSSASVSVTSTSPRTVWINRSVSTHQDIWDNGVKVVSGANASNGTSGLITILRAGSSTNVGTTAQVQAAFIGKAFTSDAMNRAVHDALKAFRQTIAGV